MAEPKVDQPRFFAPTGPAKPLAPPDVCRIESLLSVFQCPAAGAGRGFLVGVDQERHLRLLPGEARGQLPGRLQAQLQAQELVQRPWLLQFRTLYLMAAEFLEQAPDTPGFNDPVFLSGRLYGPFSSEAGASAAAAEIPGKLSATRGDVIEGIVRGAPHAFQIIEGGALSSRTPRCFHLLLPGGSEDELRGGHGAVLVFPLLSEFCESVENEGATAGLLYDLLAALQEDLRRAQMRGAFPDLVLPVVSRRMHEKRLQARGYTIQGGTALHPLSKPSATWLGRLLQGWLRERSSLPPQGTLADFLKIARTALASLSDWPSPRAAALQARAHGGGVVDAGRERGADGPAAPERGSHQGRRVDHRGPVREEGHEHPLPGRAGGAPLPEDVRHRVLGGVLRRAGQLRSDLSPGE